MAKKKARRGRPKLPRGASKATLLSVRIQPAERKALDLAANKAGLRLSEWVRVVS